MNQKFIPLSWLFSCMLLCFCHTLHAQATLLITDNGKVEFSSDAPLEIIKAKSDKLKGAIDKTANTFAFAVDMSSFKGFNGDLQREHFHENYIETEKFPKASFSGKFIEQVVNRQHKVDKI